MTILEISNLNQPQRQPLPRLVARPLPNLGEDEVRLIKEAPEIPRLERLCLPSSSCSALSSSRASSSSSPERGRSPRTVMHDMQRSHKQRRSENITKRPSNKRRKVHPLRHHPSPHLPLPLPLRLIDPLRRSFEPSPCRLNRGVLVRVGGVLGELAEDERVAGDTLDGGNSVVDEAEFGAGGGRGSSGG